MGLRGTGHTGSCLHQHAEQHRLERFFPKSQRVQPRAAAALDHVQRGSEAPARWQVRAYELVNAGRSSRTSSYIKRRSTRSLIEAVQGALARIESVSLEMMRLVALNCETVDRIGDIDGWITL